MFFVFFSKNSETQATVVGQKFPDSKGNNPEMGIPWPQISSNDYF